MADEEIKKLVKKLKPVLSKSPMANSLMAKETLEKMLIEEKMKNQIVKDNLIKLRVAINKYLNEEIKKI